MKQNAAAAGWILVYLLLIASPLLALLFGETPAGAGFWWDFSMALGFAAMGMLGAQIVLTSRFRRAAAPFGIDIIYYFHRLAAVVAVALMLAHFLVLRSAHGESLGPVDPREAPWHMTAGRLAMLLFLALVAASLWRKPLRIEYDRWRAWHALLAIAAFAAALAHLHGTGRYTEAPAMRALWTFWLVLWAALVAYVRVIKPWTLRARPWRVAGVRPEGDRTWTLAVEPAGHPGLRFAPGQFAWLTLRSSPFRMREHPFSFSSSAAAAPRLEFTIKELGDFTNTIGTVRPGETAYVDGPYGAFTPDHHPRAPGFVLIAGGVGAAPLVSMLRTAADRGDRRPYVLICANHRREDVAFREDIDSLRGRLDLKVLHVLRDPPADWSGGRGFLDEALLDGALPPGRSDLVYFLCGPRPMTDAVQRMLRNLGVPGGRVHVELFDLA